MIAYLTISCRDASCCPWLDFTQNGRQIVFCRGYVKKGLVRFMINRPAKEPINISGNL